jgi:hypothetical protein
MSLHGAEHKGRHGSLPAAIWGIPENKSPISRFTPYDPKWIKLHGLAMDDQLQSHAGDLENFL